MKVKELIEKLQKLPEDWEVQLAADTTKFDECGSPYDEGWTYDPLCDYDIKYLKNTPKGIVYTYKQDDDCFAVMLGNFGCVDYC